MRIWFFAVTWAVVAAGVRAESPTPLDAPLARAGTTLIACAPGDHIDTSSDIVRDVYHYTLYVPHDYDDHDRRYPVMFLASPFGDATMGAFAERLVEDRWLVAMLVESRNGTADWLPNFECAYDDIAARVRVQPGMMFCSGLSGAARVCSAYPALRTGFRGMILQSAGPWGGRGFMTAGNEDMVVYATFGTLDFNFHHARRIRLFLPERVARMIENLRRPNTSGRRRPLSDGRSTGCSKRPWWPVPTKRSSRTPTTGTSPIDWRLTNASEATSSATSRTNGCSVCRSSGSSISAAKRWRLSPAWRAGQRPTRPTRRSPPSMPHGARGRKCARRDDASKGRDLDEIAAAYAAAATAHPGAVFGARAAARGKAVRWETGVYP